MYSFVIMIAMDVNRAELLVKTTPMLGFINDIVLVEIADPDPTKISVIISNIFFLFKFLFFSYNIHYHF